MNVPDHLPPSKPAATPLMRVAKPHDRSAATLGLDRDVPLLGGGALLDPTGIPLALGMEHQPDFLRAVAHACRAQVLTGRDWYSHGAIALIGPKGSGRGHAARRLAAATGLPLFVVDASTRNGRQLVSGRTAPGTSAIPPFAIAAVAASGCANPIILVEGLPAGQELAPVLAPFVDPDAGCRFGSDMLRTTFDLSQINWLLQIESVAVARRLPEGWASEVRFRDCCDDDRRLLRLSLVSAIVEEFGGIGFVHRDAIESAVHDVLHGRLQDVPIGEILDRLAMVLSDPAPASS